MSDATSEQYSKEDEAHDLAEAERLLAKIARAQSDLRRSRLRYDNSISRYLDRFRLESDALLTKQDEAMQELSEVFKRVQSHRKTKTLKLRSGEVSMREATSLVVDERLFLKLARRAGVLKLVSDPQPRKVKKTLIDRLLERRPELRASLGRALQWVTVNRMTVKLRDEPQAIVLDDKPLRTTLSEES